MVSQGAREGAALMNRRRQAREEQRDIQDRYSNTIDIPTLLTSRLELVCRWVRVRVVLREGGQRDEVNEHTKTSKSRATRCIR